MGQNGPFLAVVCVHKQVSSALGASDIVAAEDTLRYTAAQDLAHEQRNEARMQWRMLQQDMSALQVSTSRCSNVELAADTLASCIVCKAIDQQCDMCSRGSKTSETSG